VSDSVNIVEFMSLRPVRVPAQADAAQAVIRDDQIRPAPAPTHGDGQPAARIDQDVFGKGSPSPICERLFDMIRDGRARPAIFAEIEELLVTGYQNEIGEPSRPVPPAVIKAAIATVDSHTLNQLARRPYYIHDGTYYVLPGTASDIPTPFAFALGDLRPTLARILDQIRAQRLNDENPEPAWPPSSDLPFWSGLIDLVYSVDSGGYSRDYAIAKRICFDVYYGLYVLRKQQPLQLEPAIEALQILHALERIAAYQFFVYLGEFFRDNTQDSTEWQRVRTLALTLEAIYPGADFRNLHGADLNRALDAIALPIRAADPASVGPLAARPLIHPLFLKLSLDWTPFNDLRPVGMGDLMVVEQTFLGYRKGEIAHIETVLSGEKKSTVVKQTNRMETSLTYSTSQQMENTTDRQTTSRFELKREAQNVLTTTIGVGATASVTYNGSPVVSTITANANLNISRNDTSKLATSFARDVVEKAVTRVQQTVSQQRSQTVITEAIEVNRHSFENTPENDNISGVYRWVDKIYKAEVRNYGRRLMFEMILPEPAAFFVQQRLLEAAASMDLPDYPTKPDTGDVDDSTAKPVSDPSQITAQVYATLNQDYMLEDVPPPADRVDGIAIRNQAGSAVFTKATAYNDTGMKYDYYWNCAFSGLPAGYEIDAIYVVGSLTFRGKGESETNWINTLDIVLKDSAGVHSVYTRVDESAVYWNLDQGQSQPSPGVPRTFEELRIGTKTCDRYSISIYGSAKLGAGAYSAWQQSVFERLTPARKRKKDSAGDVIEDPEVAAFRTEFKGIKKPVIADLLQGKSSAWNDDVIQRELRRQCISQITGEFGTDLDKQQLTNMETMGELGIGGKFQFPGYEMTAGTAADPASRIDFRRKDIESSGYAVPQVEASRRKAAYIQFIEHAFEWEHLSHVFYPYYWSTPKRWVDLLSREDEADGNFTTFLQAGAARVLIAVRPGFEQAVMHYLATSEPWDGGSTPVIGDPLYLPVYLEIQNQQDDYTNSVRVGDPWVVPVPTSLVYLESRQYPLPSEYDPSVPLD
jgi:hypothetical protein